MSRVTDIFGGSPLQLAGDRCRVHGFHRPPVLLTEIHHIQPLGAGGVDTADNRVAVCPTGHLNVHVVLSALAHGRAVPPATRAETALARRGFAEWEAAGRPGRIV